MLLNFYQNLCLFMLYVISSKGPKILPFNINLLLLIILIYREVNL